MPAVNFREERIRHQIWSNDQIRLKLEKLKQKNMYKTYQSFEMTNVSALPWGVSLLHISPRTWRPNRAPLLHQPAQTLEEAMEMEKQKEPKRQAPSPEPFWHLPFLGWDSFSITKRMKKNDSASCYITWYRNKTTSLNITTFEDGFFWVLQLRLEEHLLPDCILAPIFGNVHTKALRRVTSSTCSQHHDVARCRSAKKPDA